jgi:DNA-binding beta-propeller fold protein YncE
MQATRSRIWIAAALLLAPAAHGAPFDALDAVQDGVGGVEGLGGARALAVSPDGGTVYVCSVTDNAVAAFAVGAGGSLTPAGVVVDGVGGVDGIAQCVDVAVSPDGRHVYAAGFGDDAIATFSRNETTGALTFVDALLDSELASSSLDGVSGIALSPDGSHLYTTAGLSDAIAVFDRDADTGLLAFVEAEVGNPFFLGAVEVAVSPLGDRVYALAQGFIESPEFAADSLHTFSRDGVTGEITLIDTEDDGADGVEGLTLPTSLAVSPDGADIYTVSGFASSAPNGPPPGRLATFEREAGTGLTSYVSFLEDDVGGVDGLDYPLGVATAADGRWVYATGAADDALAVFARVPGTGALAFDRAIRNDANPSLLLDAAIDVATDPLGRFVYVAALNDGALTVFAPEPGAALGAAAAVLALATSSRQRQRARYSARDRHATG